MLCLYQIRSGKTIPHALQSGPRKNWAWLVCLLATVMMGCAGHSPRLGFSDLPEAFAPGTIVDTRSGKPVSYDTLLADLKPVRIVYVGEVHTDAAHHVIELKIIQDLARLRPDLMVGVEMFDHSYQPVLNRWSQGRLTETDFIRTTHWYANWRYPYALYRPILEFVRLHHLPLIGLNLPFDIPPKIAVGGIDSLLDCNRHYLPEHIDDHDAAHRAFVRKIFSMHRFMSPRRFEDFYMAQCVWDQSMAEAITANLGNHTMVVLAGNGHIAHGFGIPKRVFRTMPVPFRTVYLAPAGETLSRDAADYIWVTAAAKHPPMPF